MLCTRQMNHSPALLATSAMGTAGVYLCGRCEEPSSIASPVHTAKAIAGRFTSRLNGAQPRSLDWLWPGS